MKKFNSVMNSIIKYSYIPIALIFLLVFVLSMFMDGLYSSNVTSTLNTYEDDWTISLDGSDFETCSFPVNASSSQTIVLKKKLVNVRHGQCLIFKYCYADVTASIDGEVIYESTHPQMGIINTYSGTNIFGITMKDEYEDKEITITLSHTRLTAGISIEDLYLDSAGDYFIAQIRGHFAEFVTSIIMIVLSIAALVVYFTLRIKKLSFEMISANYFLSFALFTFSMAVWVLTDLNLFWALTGNQVTNDVMTLFSFMIFPIGIIEVVSAVCHDFKPAFNGIVCAFILNLFIQTILFLFCGVELHDMLIVTQVMMFIGIITVMGLMVASTKRNSTFEKKALIVGFVLFSILAIICIIGYFLGPVNFNYTIYFLSGVFVLAMDFFFVLVKNFVKVVSNQLIYERTKVFAYKDEMTGLGNRRAYSEALSLRRDNETSPYTIVDFDVNNLKVTNDTKGHAVGDELILAAANCINQIFGNVKKDNTFRTGGDEFACIVELTHEELMERLQAFGVLCSNCHTENLNGISVAFGYASLEDNPDLDPEELAVKADEMMYARKRKMHRQNKK